MRIRLHFALFSLVAALVVSSAAARAADTLPSQMSDDAFWKLIESSSESGGEFQSENFLSNETGYQAVIPTLQQTTKPGGVYMGVGPEQNFTYIAGIRPKIAFIIDIRHQNMLEHMIYKAVFEMSADRADFIARLFSLKRPAGLTDKSTVDELFKAFDNAEPLDNAGFEKNLQELKDLLLKKHKFGLTPEDQEHIVHVYTVFREFGPQLDYNSGSYRGGGFRGGRGGMPNYAELMTATDLRGEKRSYLANEESYRFLRDLETKNLVVPLTGDFGGTKAIQSVGQYLKDHSATVTAFYLSNVEQYLFQGNGNQNGGWTNFYKNVAMLPLDASSTFIRSAGGGVRGFGGGGMRAPNVLASIQDTVAAVKGGQIQSYIDVFSLSK